MSALAGGAAPGPFAAVWGRLRRPVDAERSVVALLGVTERTAAAIVGSAIAASDDATTLLARVPRIIRELSICTAAVPERTSGEVRGPILWAETISARAASAGDPNVFVCATMTRAYDTPENRLLVAALVAIRDGGIAATSHGLGPEIVDRARRNSDLAARLLDHRTLSEVRETGVRRRSTGRLHQGRRRRSYEPVARMLQHLVDPPVPATPLLAVDLRTTAQLQLLAAVADQVERRGLTLGGFGVAGHAVDDGPIGFRHPHHATDDDPAGVWIGPTRLDVPGTDPAPGVRTVRSRADVVTAIDDAVRAGHL